MALLATPQNQAFCIKKADEGILKAASNTTLDALRRIRKVESSSQNTERLHQLDQQIIALQEKRR